ncbi:hypothetical protein MEA186_24527 [Mesorhizobium amorphae CCNWGS0123]|uniref:Uncharacterized protein n=1 Tax=Mesorhizobium amorphae CCNWGS0123 TaxID=1082933 RepID=G6YFZ9_9HYPH|nr:hypothetical protein A6B35_30190 [Mesorhizobium amorphae CCNWGS0123]EHH09353.1 hypothetical protein MEA186_24527 [Mesorhizobium amorphae CCNWGS0123]
MTEFEKVQIINGRKARHLRQYPSAEIDATFRDHTASMEILVCPSAIDVEAPDRRLFSSSVRFTDGGDRQLLDSLPE